MDGMIVYKSCPPRVNGDQGDSSQTAFPHMGQSGSVAEMTTPYPHSVH
jgi:hypothetical protein